MPCFGWQVGGHQLWLELSGGTADLDDVYLREYAPDGSPRLAAYLAWMEGRAGRELSPDHPFRLRFRLLLDREPRRIRPAMPVALRSDGANWWVENGHYRACIGRSAGGQLRALYARGSTVPAAERAVVYTDYGILPDGADSLGDRMATRGSTEADLEPDCFLEWDARELRMRFRGYMREGSWTTLTSPRVQYETVWHFGSGAAIGVETRSRVLAELKTGQRAFLAQALQISGTLRWRAEVGGRQLSGAPGTDAADRLFQTLALGAPLGALALHTRAGDVILRNLRPWGEAPQNVFLLHGGGESYTAFLAMLDGQPVDLDPRWRGFRYDLEVKPR
jgi:hypothetical protein